MQSMRKFITSLLVFFLAFFVLSATQVSAAKLESSPSGTFTIAKGQVVNDDLFVSAQTAEIDGIVNGDVFIAAATVRITGTVNGSVHIGGQNVDLEGIVKNNVYIGGQNITITGANIGGSLLVGCQSLTIDKTSVVDGSILVGAENARIDAQVKRNVFAGTGILSIGDDARIGKDLYYAAGKNQASISINAKVGGITKQAEANIPQKNEVAAIQKTAPKLFNAVALALSFGAFLGSLLVAFIYYKLFGKHFTDTSVLVSNSFWKSLGIGFLVTIALIPGMIILLITMVGIPVAGLTFLIFLIYSYLAKIVVGAVLGMWIFKKINIKASVYGACAFGLLTIFVVSRIPFIGGLFGFVVFLAGLGALTLQTFSKSK